MKAFADYTIFTDGYRDRSGLLMNASQWAANSIYVFKTRQSMNNTSGTCYVTINCNPSMTTPTNVVVLGLYDEYITIAYDEYSRITEVKTDAIAL